MIRKDPMIIRPLLRLLSPALLIAIADPNVALAQTAKDNLAPLSKADFTADPLPKAARARLGSTRLRHKSDVALARFSPNGKVLATAGEDTIRLWELATGKQLRELTETGRWQIYAVVFSKDGTKLTSIQQGGVIRLWDLGTGKQLCPPQKHPGEAYQRYGLALSSDGKTIATAGAKDVRTWDAASLKPLETFSTEGPEGNGTPAVAFSPDGKLLAANSKLDIHLWNLKTGRIQRTISAAHANGVTALVFAADSQTLVSGGNKESESVQIGNRGGGSSAEIAIWDVAAGERLANLRAVSFDSGLYSLALSADGTLLASGHHNEARVWDLEKRELAWIIKDRYSVHGGYPCTMDLSPDGKWLAARIDGHAVGLWDAETGELSENSETHRQSITSLASTSDGKILVTSSGEDTVRLWDPSAGKVVSQFQMNGQGTGFSALAITPDGKALAAAGGYRLLVGREGRLEFKGNLLISDLAHAAVLVESNFSDVIGSLAYSPDGGTLIATTNNQSPQKDEAILVIDADDGTERSRLSHPGQICRTSLSADGKTLYSVGIEARLREWDVKAAKVKRTIEVTGHERPQVTHAAFSRDSTRLATADRFGKVLVITDVPSGKRIREIAVPDTLGNLLAISPDGRILAAACQPITATDTRFDEQIHLWDIATGEKLVSFDASTDGTVATLFFLPDGKTLVSGMDRGTALLWDLTNIRAPR
jgi:WD40 repeat protein